MKRVDLGSGAEPNSLMLEVEPLRGVLYDPDRAGPLDRLLAPPYDVISPAEREVLAARSPHSIVHLILPAGEGDARYAAAAGMYREWFASGILHRDTQPAVYRYQQSYTAEGRSFTGPGSSPGCGCGDSQSVWSCRTSARCRRPRRIGSS